MPADALHRVHARHADAPFAIRAAAGPGVAIASRMTALPIGKGEVRRTTSRRTNRIAILAFGSMVAAGARRRGGARRDGRQHALRQAARHRSRVAARAASTTRSSRSRRTSSPAARAARSPKRSRPQGIVVPLLQLGLPDAFVDHGDPAQLLAECGLDAPRHRRVHQRAVRAAADGSAREARGVGNARMAPMRPIAIFRFSRTEGPAYFADWLDARGFAWQLVALDEGAPVPVDPRAFAGIAHDGRSDERQRRASAGQAPLGALLRAAVDRDVPVLGHCLGGQLARAGAGRAGDARAGRRRSAGSTSTSATMPRATRMVRRPRGVRRRSNGTTTRSRCPPGATPVLTNAFNAQPGVRGRRTAHRLPVSHRDDARAHRNVARDRRGRASRAFDAGHAERGRHPPRSRRAHRCAACASPTTSTRAGRRDSRR